VSKKLKLKAKIASVLGSCCTCLAFAGVRESGKAEVGGWVVGWCVWGTMEVRG